MKLNVSQTDEYVSVDSEQTFDLSLGYALVLNINHNQIEDTLLDRNGRWKF